MKKDTIKLLKEALNSIASDYNLSDARYHIRQAVNKIEEKQLKKSKHKAANAKQFQETWGNTIAKQSQAKVSQPWDLDHILNNINSMIDQEEKKIEEIKNKNNQQDQEEEFHTLND